jgi:hypothetical protein
VTAAVAARIEIICMVGVLFAFVVWCFSLVGNIAYLYEISFKLKLFDWVFFIADKLRILKTSLL